MSACNAKPDGRVSANARSAREPARAEAGYWGPASERVGEFEGRETPRLKMVRPPRLEPASTERSEVRRIWRSRRDGLTTGQRERAQRVSHASEAGYWGPASECVAEFEGREPLD